MRRRLIISLLVAVVVTAAGLTAALAVNGDEDGSEPTVPRRDAVAIAQTAAGGGDVIDVERDDEDGGPVYEVRVESAKGVVEVVVDASTGDVLATEHEDVDDGTDDEDDNGEDDNGEDEDDTD